MSTNDHITRFLNAGGKILGFHDDGSPDLCIELPQYGGSTITGRGAKDPGMSAHEKLAWRAAAARLASMGGKKDGEGRL